jgi:hypothetical protein
VSTLRSGNGYGEVVYTSNEMAAFLDMSWAGLSKWLATRPRFAPKYTLEMGRTKVQLWDKLTMHKIRIERELG